MHSILFVANPALNPDTWAAFTEQIDKKIKPTQDALRLAENVWLVNLQASVAPFGWLVASADIHGVSYGILPFEHEPEWLPVGFDPSTT